MTPSEGAEMKAPGMVMLTEERVTALWLESGSSMEFAEKVQAAFAEKNAAPAAAPPVAAEPVAWITPAKLAQASDRKAGAILHALNVLGGNVSLNQPIDLALIGAALSNLWHNYRAAPPLAAQPAEISDEQIDAFHRLPEVRGKLLDYADNPTDENALRIVRICARALLAAQPAGMREALAELVACQDMRERSLALNATPMRDVDWTEYHQIRDDRKRREPIAWERARALLAAQPVEPKPQSPFDAFRDLAGRLGWDTEQDYAGGAFRDTSLQTVWEGMTRLGAQPVEPKQSDQVDSSSRSGEGQLSATDRALMERAMHWLNEFRAVFAAPNFTDRYGYAAAIAPVITALRERLGSEPT